MTTLAAPMFEKVAFTMLPVKDATRARDFYENVLGLTPGSRSKDGLWTEYDLPGGGCLALYGGPDQVPTADVGTTIALEVADLDGLITTLKAKGVTFRGDLIHSPVCRMSIMLDSEGNGILLHELKKK